MFARIIALITSLFLSQLAVAQGTWIWEWGNLTAPPISSAGLGVFAATNFPDARYAAVYWTTPSGTFWRYGGDAGADLWQFDPTLMQWAHMHGPLAGTTMPTYGTQGVPNAANTPGSDTYGHPAWVDSQGDLWMYSVNSSDDLWKFDVALNQWVWIHGTATFGAAPVYGTLGIPGPTVSPGQCNETDCKWVDSNDNLWLFNELTGTVWKYDPLINQWTWMHGTPNGTPVYGTIGLPAPANEPGVFSACPSVGTLYSMWSDSNDDFWMIVNRAGATVDAEIWKYHTALNQWACMRIDVAGFGATQSWPTPCLESNGIFPVPRTEMRARWVDDCDNMWTYGGITFCASGTDYADLWRFSPATNNWMYVRGTTTGAVYQTMGVPDPVSQPGPGAGQQHWQNQDGLWLHGGQSNLQGAMHPIWRYQPDTVIADFSHTTTCLTTSFTDFSTTGCNNIKSYSWNFGDLASGNMNTDTIANPVHVFSASGTYQVTLIVQNCTWDADTMVQSITVNCGVQVSLAPDTICLGDCVDLTAQATGGTPPYSFVWDQGIATTTAGPVNVCPTADTPYAVIVTDSAGLMDTASATVTVLPQVVVDLGPDTALCDGPWVLDALNTGATFLWQDGSTGQQFTVDSTGWYSVTVDNGGCTQTESIYVQINGPTVDLGPDLVTCNPSLLLDAGNNGSTYLWQDGSTNQTFSVVDTGMYFVTVIDSLGCMVSDTLIVLPDSIGVELGPDTFACTGATISFDAGNAGSTFLWNSGNSGQVEIVSTSGPVWVTVSNGICEAADTVQVLLDAPVASFAPDDTSGCPPVTTLFTDWSTSATSGIAQWDWSFGDGSTSTLQHPTHSYDLPGSYTVTLAVSDSNSCSHDTTMPLLITVYPEPAASYSYDPEHPDVTNPTVHFTDLSIGAVAWHWDFGDGSSSTLQHPAHTYDGAGSFTVTLTVTNEFGCEASIVYTIVIDAPFSIYVPNAFTPNGDGINDFFGAKGEGILDFELLIFNRWGELIFESNDIDNLWDGSYRQTLVESDVYVWKVNVQSIEQKYYNLSGHVTVVR